MSALSDRESWIKETQMFQRIAKLPESSDEELGYEWDAITEGDNDGFQH